MRRTCAAVAVLVAGSLTAPGARAQSAPDQDQVVDVPGGDEYADTDPSALSDFTPALDPYGTWVVDPTYGMVWTPSADQVGATFQPYDTAGSWNYVDGDYAWVSDYAWGWVCFHYGRWALSAGRWVWIPGRRYAAAWVSWRVSDDGDGYVGWAPMAPTWFWLGGSAFALTIPSPEPWAFATYGDFAAQRERSRRHGERRRRGRFPHARLRSRAAERHDGARRARRAARAVAGDARHRRLAPRASRPERARVSRPPARAAVDGRRPRRPRPRSARRPPRVASRGRAARARR